MALATIVLGCGRSADGPSIAFIVDLREPGRGVVPVEMRVTSVAAGRSLALSSFIQPEALRLETIDASQGASALAVTRARDERGFERFVVAPASHSHPIVVRYTVRPGAAEESEMSGLSGYRFGYLDERFGLLGGRQAFLLPMEAGPIQRIDVRFLLPPQWTVAVPWLDPSAGSGSEAVARRPGDGATFHLEGGSAAAVLVEATLGAGEFDGAGTGGFRAWASRSLPDTLRRDALRRALALERHLASHLGRSAQRYDLVLVPKSPDGMLISVVAGPNSHGLSLGEGLPTRWLTIGRALGRAYVEARWPKGRIPEKHRWFLEALPTYLTIAFSERSRWRTREAWLEQFYYDAAGLTLDLRKPDDLGGASDPMMREWRGALVLDRILSEWGSFDDRLRRAAERRQGLDVVRLFERELPGPLRRKVDGWLAPTSYAIPFPGLSEALRPVLLRTPPSATASPSSPRAAGRRVDLYFGGRNLGLLEQCGCRSRQAGGFTRRTTLLRGRLRHGVPSLAIELGDAIPFDQHAFFLDPQKQAESDLAFELLARAGAAASVVSHAELSYGPRFLADRVARLRTDFELLSANLQIPGLSLPPFLDRNLGGVNVRVIGLEDPAAYHHGRPLEFEDAISGIRFEGPGSAALRALETRGTALPVIAGSLSPTTILELYRNLPEGSIIVTNDYFHFTQDPRFAFERPLGSSLATLGRLEHVLIVLLRTDAYGLARVGLRVDDRGRSVGAEIEDLVLDESVADDPDTRRRLDAHYEWLARQSDLTEPAPIGTRLSQALGASFAGGASCGSCHAEQAEQWQSTAHASAFATLLAKRRQGVPGCFACHVTGYRQPTGYRAAADVGLRNVQCESCHGPGSRHASEPRRDNIVRIPTFAQCAECHDEKHSEMTAENFDSYRARITHAVAAPAAR